MSMYICGGYSAFGTCSGALELGISDFNILGRLHTGFYIILQTMMDKDSSSFTTTLISMNSPYTIP